MKRVLYMLIGVLLMGGLSGSLRSTGKKENLDTTTNTQNNEQEKGILTRARETTGKAISDIGNISIWNLGQIKDLLPFAIVFYCFSKHPNQTLIVLGGLLVWCLFKTERGDKWLQKFRECQIKCVNRISKPNLFLESDQRR